MKFETKVEEIDTTDPKIGQSAGGAIGACIEANCKAGWAHIETTKNDRTKKITVRFSRPAKVMPFKPEPKKVAATPVPVKPRVKKEGC